MAVKGVNIADVRLTPILLPPLAEQHRIVAEVERRLSVVEEMEKTIDANLKRAERLRQAILARAFAGNSSRRTRPTNRRVCCSNGFERSGRQVQRRINARAGHVVGCSHG